MDVETQERTHGNTGILRLLADLPPETVISEEALAESLGKPGWAKPVGKGERSQVLLQLVHRSRLSKREPLEEPRQD
jgi:hypothetical protein